MTERFDAVSPRKGKDGKTRWIKVGAGFPKGDRIHIVFDALPLPDDEGRVMVMLSPYVAKKQQSDAETGGSFGDMENDLPF
jgi:hypothetical protein